MRCSSFGSLLKSILYWNYVRSVAEARDRVVQHADIDASVECSGRRFMDIAFAADARAADLIGPLIQSAQLHSNDPKCLRFHLLVPRDVRRAHEEDVWNILSFHRLAGSTDREVLPLGFGMSKDAVRWRLIGGATLRIVPFDTTQLDGLMKVVGSATSDSVICNGLEGCDPSRAQRLQKPTNFARFFLADLLPDVAKVMWVDCDIIFQNDLDVLWRRAFAEEFSASNALIAAFVEDVPLGRFYFNPELVKSLWQERYGRELDLTAVSFNDGAIVIDLDQWRSAKVSEEVLWWMQKHKDADPALWKFGTQPIMLLVGFGRWQQLPSEWYFGDLGFRRIDSSDNASVDHALVLHFDGEHKPWLPEVVSDINVLEHGLVAGWNTHLLRNYMPVTMPDFWFAAPGARCLSAPQVHTVPYSCEVGPLTAGVSVPGLQWLAPNLTGGTEGPQHTPELFGPITLDQLPMVDRSVAGFFSAAALSTSAGTVLDGAVFDISSAKPVLELYFFRPQKVLDAYLQAVSALRRVSGGRLQHRSSVRDRWHDACRVQQRASCIPRRGPSFTAGAAEVCWEVSGCRSAPARHWRVVDWAVEADEQHFGSLWLTLAAGQAKPSTEAEL